jgi:hypothetical protein
MLVPLLNFARESNRYTRTKQRKINKKKPRFLVLSGLLRPIDAAANTKERVVATLAARTKPSQGLDGRQGVLLALLLVLLAHGSRRGGRRSRHGAVVARAEDDGGVGTQVAVLHGPVWVELGVRADASEADFLAAATGPGVGAGSMALDLPLRATVHAVRRRNYRNEG